MEMDILVNMTNLTKSGGFKVKKKDENESYFKVNNYQTVDMEMITL